MFIDELKKHFRILKQKDEAAIQSVEKHLYGRTRKDRHFARKVDDVQAAFDQHTSFIAAVLREYIANQIGDFCFNRTFSDAVVRSVLKDREFVAMLIKANLINRAAKLDRHTKGQVKLRIYIAIINFDDYKKEQAFKK